MERQKRTLLQYLGLLGVVSLLSYTIAVVFSPLAYPGYDWLSMAVSDLSAETAPSKGLWNQLSSLYGAPGLVSIMAVCVFISTSKPLGKTSRVGIYLFALMNWISFVGYTMFPLSEAGKGMTTFQDIMHVYVVTLGVVLFSIVSLVLLAVGGFLDKRGKTLGILAMVALLAMMIGSIGTGIVPSAYFGLVERFSVFAAVSYNAVLGLYLFFH